jgi:cytochrome bd ubiquinol oxidase subunit I
MSVASFLAMFVLVYGVVFGAGIYYLRLLIRKGPAASYAPESEEFVNRPISAALADAGSPEAAAMVAPPAE